MGVFLGRIVDVEFDNEQMVLVNIVVQPRGIVGVFKKPLIISRTQIIEITSQQIIVEDAAVSTTAEAEPA